MEKPERIQEILEVLRDDQRYFDQTILEIKERAAGSLNSNRPHFKGTQEVSYRLSADDQL